MDEPKPMTELTRIRQERNLSQQGLADASGVNKATINQIERGRRSPNVETLEKLSTALGVDVGDLFTKAQPQLPLEGPKLPKNRLSPSSPRPAELPFDVTELAREALAESGADTEEDSSRVLERAFAEAFAGWSRADLLARYEWADHDVLHALPNMPASRAKWMRANLERYAAAVGIVALDRAEALKAVA